ncbi:MAG: hypothetical protein UY72_C0030G0009 [Candidatus Uhrbacteria bacterium GW2011_GWD2_52_7]|uniref:ATP-dependent Clp protease proteolytic subunit n=1 Tax=Candidatus Uhrbacteria bacterium GW2011_GWD2_52_7 TaxID=1618989 RepID=A0A0G1XG09_9BACT|nr:MAG: hypothetical protein UY72_C0030G0009 [Candidatus Uhrbacteria bacterium GW2011_GWD2_52_7]
MRYLPFTCEISARRIERLITDLRAPDAPRAVYVDSPGGQFTFFSTFGPAIKRYGLTTVSGDVRSAAVVLYLLGHRRIALPDSTFFFHEVRTLITGQGEMTICDVEHVLETQEQILSGPQRECIEEWLHHMRLAQNWFLGFMARETQLPTSTFLNLMRDEATLDAREARRYGIVHEIVSEDELLRN